ncbi:MAG: hypothetical protein HY719_06445 [Planctomycetes bacterium]|nr:hypothetical protein [Planctomycetota bacterium]
MLPLKSSFPFGVLLAALAAGGLRAQDSPTPAPAASGEAGATQPDETARPPRRSPRDRPGRGGPAAGNGEHERREGRPDGEGRGGPGPAGGPPRPEREGRDPHRRHPGREGEGQGPPLAPDQRREMMRKMREEHLARMSEDERRRVEEKIGDVENPDHLLKAQAYREMEFHRKVLVRLAHHRFEEHLKSHPDLAKRLREADPKTRGQIMGQLRDMLENETWARALPKAVREEIAALPEEQREAARQKAIRRFQAEARKRAAESMSPEEQDRVATLPPAEREEAMRRAIARLIDRHRVEMMLPAETRERVAGKPDGERQAIIRAWLKETFDIDLDRLPPVRGKPAPERGGE